MESGLSALRNQKHYPQYGCSGSNRTDIEDFENQIFSYNPPKSHKIISISVCIFKPKMPSKIIKRRSGKAEKNAVKGSYFKMLFSIQNGIKEGDFLRKYFVSQTKT